MSPKHNADIKSRRLMLWAEEACSQEERATCVKVGIKTKIAKMTTVGAGLVLNIREKGSLFKVRLLFCKFLVWNWLRIG